MGKSILTRFHLVINIHKYQNIIYNDKYGKQSKVCIIFRYSINSNDLTSYVLRKITLNDSTITFLIYSANANRKLTPEELLNILRKKKVSTHFAKYCIKITHRHLYF